MKCSLVAIVSAAGLLCLGGTPAWAGSTSTDVNWTYNFTPGQPSVSSNTGTGTVTFTNEPTKSATNSSDVVVTNLRVNSVAPSGTPDSFSSTGGMWKVGLVLTDSSSGNSTTMNFSGQLGGTWSANNSNLTNTFTGTTNYSWTDPKSGDTFKVNLVGYTPPGPPTASNAGSIAAYVQVTPAGGGGGISSTPEPSTLVLSILGLGFAGLTTWQKRRRSLAAMLA
jgi:hypothetical protein